MKHTLKVIITLVLFFFLAQFTGLLIINHYIDHKKTLETKEIVMKPLPYGLERPEVKNQSASFIYITIAILIGTAILFLIIKTNYWKIIYFILISFILYYTFSIYINPIISFILSILISLVITLKTSKMLIWKLWFFATVWLTLSIALAAFINNIVAAILALIISILKVYKPDIIIQNLSEIFIYGGLASIFVPVINIFAAFMLLIVISIYDFIAVFKTKHMIKLAKFQSESKVFAGLLIPYRKGKMLIKGKMTQKMEQKPQKARIAVLGGGDIGFPLIFAGVVMKGLMFHNIFFVGFLKTLIIPVVVSLALFILLLKGQQNKFYPAMPVLSVGCFIGYLIVWLI